MDRYVSIHNAEYNAYDVDTLYYVSIKCILSNKIFLENIINKAGKYV